MFSLLQQLENGEEKEKMKSSITIPGHELEFVDELYTRDEEGQRFTTPCLGSSQNIPAEKQSSLSIHKVSI